MPDVWSAVAALDDRTQDRLVEVLETRGADPQQRAMRGAFLADIPFSGNARVLDVGCGTGVLTRAIARLPDVQEVIGLDPAPSLLSKACALAAGQGNVSFREGDGRSLPFADKGFDVVVFDSTLCHVPEPEKALAEAARVLRQGGILAAFDGDYATATVAIGDHDPLQTAVAAMIANSVNDRWLARRLPAMARALGFEVLTFRSYGFVATAEGYMLTVIDRGVDILTASGQVTEDTAAALKREARDRIDAGKFFGHIAYASLVARKPAHADTQGARG